MRRLLAAGVLTIALVAGGGGLAQPALAASAGSQGDTAAVAVNTKDGASIFRLAFSVRRVVGDVVDQSNAAAAVASCIDCQTVALAFQVVLVMGDPDVVTPENLALAINTECSYCTTYAAATQLVLSTDGLVRVTPEGMRRLAELRKRLQDLKDEELTVGELDAIVQAARAELRDIVATQLVPVSNETTASGATAPTAGSTTTTTGSSSTSSTTQPSSTSTTRATTTSTPTSTTSSSTTSSTSTTTTSTTVA